MKTLSMKECVLMWKSREPTNEANFIPLVTTFLNHLGEQRKKLENMKVNIYIKHHREIKIFTCKI